MMVHTIGVGEVGSQLDQILQEVVGGADYVVERDGEPVAALVPIEVYESWNRRREAFFTQMDEIATRVNLTPEEADALAAEAVQAVRAAHAGQ